MTWRVVDLQGPVGTSPVAARLVDGPDTEFVLVRTRDGSLHATEQACPHLGQPLTRGSVDGDVLECGQHFYRYRLADGVCIAPGGPLAGRLTVHEVREVDGRIEVRIAESAA